MKWDQFFVRQDNTWQTLILAIMVLDRWNLVRFTSVFLVKSPVWVWGRYLQYLRRRMIFLYGLMSFDGRKRIQTAPFTRNPSLPPASRKELSLLKSVLYRYSKVEYIAHFRYLHKTNTNVFTLSAVKSLKLHHYRHYHWCLFILVQLMYTPSWQCASAEK